jgi:hypothetical protein
MIFRLLPYPPACVVVTPHLARPRELRELAQRLHEVRAGRWSSVWRVELPLEAGCMSEEVPEPQLAGSGGVVQRKARQVVLHPCLDVELALVVQTHHGGATHRLRYACDLRTHTTTRQQREPLHREAASQPVPGNAG